jgi:hypothetical protein
MPLAQRKFEVARAAPVVLRAARIFCGHLEVGDCSVINPAAGTLKVGPAYREKVCKTLMREVSRIKLRLHFSFAHL